MLLAVVVVLDCSSVSVRLEQQMKVKVCLLELQAAPELGLFTTLQLTLLHNCG